MAMTVRKDYQRTRAVSALKPSTRHAYTEVLDRVLVPRFGKRRLTEIDVAQLAEMDAALVKDELSASSRRNVHIVLRSPTLRDLLELAAKKPHRPSSPVAPTTKGNVWGEWGLRLAFQRAQTRAKLSGFRFHFHDLRHIFVTELFRGGSPAPAVQALAGHADLTTTQRYAHMVKSDLQAAIATLERGKGVETSPGT
jgi:integrase